MPSSPSNAPSTTAWSQRLEARYGFSLPPDLASWFDEELWRDRGPSEYGLPVSPEILLGDSPESIWPPLMPPFFLPLVGHPGGDWLCLRLKSGPNAADSTTVPTDICQWYHGGGDWLPWGDTLAEALLFDAVLPHLPGAAQLHAVPAESAASAPVSRWVESTWGRWASRWLPAPHDGATKADELMTLAGQPLAAKMVAAGWCEVAVRCQCIIGALSHRLRTELTPSLANQMGWSWNDVLRWCFDLRTLPSAVARTLIERCHLNVMTLASDQQDWAAAERHARAIAAAAPDLAWGHELLAYCQHVRGDNERSRPSLAAALRCSVFTDQSVRLRTHWATTGKGRPAKFAASFLKPGELVDGLIGGPTDDALIHRLPDTLPLGLYLGWLQADQPAATIRQTVTTALRRLASESMQSGNHATAVTLLLAAGWDLGAEPMRSYAELLDELIAACRLADWQPHTELAQTHRRCLQSRYGI